MRRLAVLCFATLVLAGCGGTSDKRHADRLGGGLAEDRRHRVRQGVRRRRREGLVRGLGRARRADPQGVKPDVFASANTKLPDALYKEAWSRSRRCSPPTGSCSRCRPTAPRSTSLERPRQAGRRRSRSAPTTVPVGSYTRKVLDKLPPAQAKAILANVRSKEPDVARHRRQAHPGRGRRRLRLRHRRAGGRRQAEGDRAARRSCSRRSPTASRSSRAPSTPSRRRRSSTGCSTATGAGAATRAGFLPPPAQ